MLKEIVETGAVALPWPTAIDGQFVGVSRLPRHLICDRRCQESRCLDFSDVAGAQMCQHKLTFYHRTVGPHQVVVYGVIGTDRAQLPADAYFKANSKGRSVTWQDFAGWVAALARLYEFVHRREDSVISTVLHPLHDPIRLAGRIEQIAELIIRDNNAVTFDEGFKRASLEEKSLYKAAGLLVETFESVKIYLNPAAAAFGQRRDIQVFRLIDKLVYILGLGERRVRLEGQTYSQYRLLESFKLLPFALIQNALKYGTEGDVVIRLEENPQGIAGLRVAVQSTGPVIYEDEYKEIFAKGRRGRAAQVIQPEGMGVGLYIARIVADANGISLGVSSQGLGRVSKGVPLAETIFWFFVPGALRLS